MPLPWNHQDVVQVEVNGVVEIIDDPVLGSFCEVNNEQPQFYSTYVRLNNGLIECTDDFDTMDAAIKHGQDMAVELRVPIKVFC